MAGTAAKGQEADAQAHLVETVVQAAGPEQPDSSLIYVGPSDAEHSELPASVASSQPWLPLAPEGMQTLPDLPATGHGCGMCPVLQCTGPEYCGCSPRIYYGTNPCDDDPILPLNSRINDWKLRHWYNAGLRMILRKKAVTERLK